MTSGDSRPGTFDQAAACYKLFSEIFGGHDVGSLLVGGCAGCEGQRALPPGAEQKAYAFGKQLK